MKIVILTADGYSKYFDRRIVDQAKILVENGNKVQIITTGDKNSFHEIDDISVIQFQRNRTKKDINQTIEDFWKFHSTGEKRTSSDIQETNENLETKIKMVWRRLPVSIRHKIGPLFFSFYTLFQMPSKKRESLFGLRGKDIKVDIWNDAASFVTILEDQNADLIVASDLASGIASLVLRFRNHSGKIWYDAHEYGSEQAWLKKRPGFTNEIKLTELAIVKGVDLFSCVSEELALLIAEHADRKNNNVVLPNIALKQLTGRIDSIDSQIKTLREIRKTHKVAIFHGVLSDIRGIDKFIEAFDKACLGEWRLVLMGYFLEGRTSRAISRSKTALLLEAVDAKSVLSIISEVDVVVMPYDIVDLNTEFCFPNKLGDCLAIRSKFIFNGNLKSISKIAEKFSIGLPFEMSTHSIDIESLQKCLQEISTLEPNWDQVDFEFGEESYRKSILSAVEKVFSGQNF